MMKNVLIFPATVLAIGILAGCSGGESDSADGTESASDRSVQSNPIPRGSSASRERLPDVTELDDDKPIIEAPRLRGSSETDAGGLDLVIFASGRQEYRDSLRLIAEGSTDTQFQQLDAALRWLLINDPSIMNNEQRLFDTVNGKTGNQVLELVAERVNGRAQ